MVGFPGGFAGAVTGVEGAASARARDAARARRSAACHGTEKMGERGTHSRGDIDRLYACFSGRNAAGNVLLVMPSRARQVILPRKREFARSTAFPVKTET